MAFIGRHKPAFHNKKFLLQAIGIVSVIGVFGAGVASADIYIRGEADCQKCDHVVAGSKGNHKWMSGRRVVIEQKGEGYAEEYKGFGKDVPVDAALKSIVPNDFSMYVENSVNPDVKLNWKQEDGTWVEALYDALDDTDMTAEVDWNDKTVRISRSRKDVPMKVAATPTADNKKKDSEAEGGTSQDSSDESGSQNPRKIYISGGVLYLADSTYLSEALDEYVRYMGWRGVRWELDEDYMIIEPIPVKDYVNLVKGITYVLSAYRDQGALVNTDVIYRKANKIVEVTYSDTRKKAFETQEDMGRAHEVQKTLPSVGRDASDAGTPLVINPTDSASMAAIPGYDDPVPVQGPILRPGKSVQESSDGYVISGGVQ